MGFRVTHQYGLTETYGPATLCATQDGWRDLAPSDRARQMARQGVPMPTLRRADRRRSGNPAAGAARRATRRRGHAARQYGHEGLPQERGGDSGGLARRLVSYRRPRGVASGQLHRDQGPRQGHHHLRRREHQLAGSRGVPLSPPAGDGSRRRRPAGREVGRDAVRVRGAAPRCTGRQRRGAYRLVPRAAGALQGAAHA